MSETENVNRAQKDLWNGRGGQAWGQSQALLDAMFAPVAAVLLDSCDVQPGESVLDVGCGAGAVSLAFARRVGGSGHVLGVDISEPLLAAARARATRDGLEVAFHCADAQLHDFPRDRFDWIVSRFGVMFFDDPVQAFANFRGATRPGGHLRCVAWRGPEQNLFMTAAERAAAPFLPEMPKRPADAPGQFGFAGRERVAAILRESGWSDVQLKPIDVTCALPAGALPHYVAQVGPLSRILPDTDAATRERALAAAMSGFASFAAGDQFRFTAACWSIAAQRS